MYIPATIPQVPQRIGIPVWGTGGTCSWADARTLVARFGPGEDAQLLVLGDFVEVFPTVTIRSALAKQLNGAASG